MMCLRADKSSDVNDTDRQSLLDSIDYNRLSENSLQTALDSKLVPAAFVAKAALNLCATLRSDLEAANEVIRRHKTDLDRAINGGTSSARELARHNGLGSSLESAERSRSKQLDTIDSWNKFNVLNNRKIHRKSFIEIFNLN